MFKFFRKIRQRLVTENKVSKYLLYAIGEIILVVIGILIAIQLNNAKAERENNIQLTNIFKTIKDDLEKDAINVENRIFFYQSKDSLLTQILSDQFLTRRFDTINSSNYEDCRFCRSLITNFAFLRVSKNGYLRLSEFSNKNKGELDSLSLSVMQWYREIIDNVESRGENIRNLAGANHEFLEQYVWYLDYIERRYNEESVKFFTKNSMYHNKVATYRAMAISNYLRWLFFYEEEIIRISDLIDKRLNKE